ncbi:UNVERIFIED_CONTAM: hypothetical protein Slati_1750400 [Sesamum latifolium]|uniref:DUF4283 domain-containing protein n=1 Tax=Sesamum latifolium TaxID=2727402 RepID=A0AAW2WXL4_9LAMI
MKTGQPSKATMAEKSCSGKGIVASKDESKVSEHDFHAFISDLASPQPATNPGSTSTAPAPAKAMTAVQPAPVPSLAVTDDRNASHPVHRPEKALPDKDATTEAMGIKRTSFTGLFSTNRRPMDEKKLRKIAVNDETLTLDTNDLIDVRTKLGHCLVGYIAGKFSGLKAIGALSKSWGATFQQHASGWLVFKFATEEDMQRVVADGPYFVFGRPLMLKTMPACFGFQEDDISLTPIWATLPSLPLECWNPNALSKIGSRLGNPMAMDSLTMNMERISYARILVEVDASKELVDQVEFILPNGVVRKQPVRYEFTPKFCTTCNRFGHLSDSCQGHRPTVVAAPAANAKPATPKKAQATDWTLVQRRHKTVHKEQTPQACESVKPANQQPGSPTAGSDKKRQQGLLVPQQCVLATGKEDRPEQNSWSTLWNTHRQDHRVPPLIRAPYL